tara:strand:+ start:2233 stop:2508 length:276 start_codon:yes stop_codon:yes gene_type:complete
VKADKKGFELFRDLMQAFDRYARAAQKEIGLDGDNSPKARLDKLMKLTPWYARVGEAARDFAEHAGVSDKDYALWLRQNPDEPSYFDKVLK